MSESVPFGETDNDSYSGDDSDDNAHDLRILLAGLSWVLFFTTLCFFGCRRLCQTGDEREMYPPPQYPVATYQPYQGYDPREGQPPRIERTTY